MKIAIKVIDGGKTETIQHEVQKINLGQFQKSLQILKEVADVLGENEGLRQIFYDIFQAEGDARQGFNDVEFFSAILQSFEALLLHLPDHAVRLLAAMSGIDQKVLKDQPLEDVFEVYDAILETNDIEKLIARAKKSFAVTRTKTAFLKKSREATEAVAAPVTK